MKKIKFLFALVSLNFLFTECNNDNRSYSHDIQFENITSNLNNKRVGAFLIHSGVNDVKISNTKNNGVIFRFLTQKEIGIEKQSYNLANYEFRLQGNKLSLGSYSIQKVGDKYIILLNNKIVDVKNNSKLLSDINFVILSIVYDELSKTKLASYDEFITTEHESRYACPWWKTHTITGIGWTSGGAKADLFNATIQDANDGDLHGCTSLGGVEINSRLGGLYFTATQSFCCP